MPVQLNSFYSITLSAKIIHDSFSFHLSADTKNDHSKLTISKIIVADKWFTKKSRHSKVILLFLGHITTKYLYNLIALCDVLFMLADRAFSDKNKE